MTVLEQMVEGAIEGMRKQAHYDFIHDVIWREAVSIEFDIADMATRHAYDDVRGDGGIADEIALDTPDIVHIELLLADAYSEEFHKLMRGEVQPVDPVQ